MAGGEVKSPEGEVEELHFHSRGRIQDLFVMIYVGETRHRWIKRFSGRRRVQAARYTDDRDEVG